jgi:DNA-binding CsgD family transcriptional regulator
MRGYERLGSGTGRWAIDGELTGAQVAAKLNLSVRQVRRLLRRLRIGGAASLTID